MPLAKRVYIYIYIYNIHIEECMPLSKRTYL